MKKLILLSGILFLVGILFSGCGKDQSSSSSNLLQEVKGNDVLKVGLMGTYPPYNFLNDKNEIDGFDADIAKEVAKRLGVKVEFVPTEWAGMIGGLQAAKFDVVISQMTITDERKQTLDFSNSYITNAVNIIVDEKNNSINTLADFKGKKIGVALGTNDETFLRNEVLPKIGNFEIVTYNDPLTSLIDLNAGRIDATINNIFAIKPLVDKNNLKIKKTGEALKQDQAGVAVRKGNPELLEAINTALTAMKTDGTYRNIFVKWFDVEPE
jgi:L-cystine transport system substrate-binding protein